MKAKHFVCVSKNDKYSFYEGNRHIISVEGQLTKDWLERYRQDYTMLLADVTPPIEPEVA